MGVFIVCMLFLMMINAILIKTSLDEQTKYKNDIYDQPNVMWLFLFLGVFCLLFKKRIQLYRKNTDFKIRLNLLKKAKPFVMFNSQLTEEEYNEEIVSLERYLKLNKLKRKTKWSIIR